MFAQVQVPEPDDPDDAVTRPHGGVRVVYVFLLLPHDDGHVERYAVHVDDDAEHAVEHAQRQRHLEQAIDAGEQFHARAVDGPQVAYVGRAERGYAQPAGRGHGSTAAAGRGHGRQAPPARVFGLVHQRLDVVVQGAEPEIQRHAHQVEELFDDHARDVRQRREQTDQFGRTEREPARVSYKRKYKTYVYDSSALCYVLAKERLFFFFNFESDEIF